jgi:Copper transport outer membrane protein, MctB
MINFRFHIVSLTAVLLALGIGLVLGTTFFDDALERTLKGQLNDLEAKLDQARARDDDLASQLHAYQDESSKLDEQLGERLYKGELTGDPVLVVATRGVDKRWVDTVSRDLTQADADVLGTWWLTPRLALDDSGEVRDMESALQVSFDDTTRLRQRMSQDLSDALFGATDVRTAPGLPAPPAEPAVATRLRAAGFLEYQMPEGSHEDVVKLPGSGLRVVVVDGPGAAVPAASAVEPILTELSDDGPVPVVVVQPTPDPNVKPDKKNETTTPLVVEIRGDGTLKDRLSTVDDLDRVSGGVATVLALSDAKPGAPVVGHYGMGGGASRLLPPLPGEK